MRLLKTEITPFINEMMHIEMREQPFFWSPFQRQPSLHVHPEFQLTFIVEGYGKRIVGNSIERFEPGDMVFLGSNVPHVWLSDPVFYQEGIQLQSKVIIAYFNPKVFYQIFNMLKEFDSIREMICQASKGIRVMGETKNIIAEKLKILINKRGFDKVEGLLQIMNLISVSEEKSFIADTMGEINHSYSPYSDKLTDVVNFINDNLHEPISLRQAADIACMTETSFCRFFKRRTKKSFSQYLNALRINRACEILRQTNKAITDVACICGFNSVSHFSRVFKEHTGVNPFHYRRSINETLF
ncbi:MAG: helix-turn-helix domain-containing protein [Chitinophagaceae bacterium]|nr:helix-turn-helix domain-containing protein [Chitinophagaceae bacterium]MCW5927288.1 helix-turn-helix domain-containing protein [Chitinophagaceae bacterium]